MATKIRQKLEEQSEDLEMQNWIRSRDGKTTPTQPGKPCDNSNPTR